MSDQPAGRAVNCPECNARAFAVVPGDSTLVEREAESDGKVWATCRECGEQFLVYYRAER